MTALQPNTRPLSLAAQRPMQRSGFTLVETMIASTLMGLIFVGAMTLFLASTQTALRTTVQN